MEELRYIQLILPLRLEWEPYYLLPEYLSVAVGDRVMVEFACKEYVGVVSAVDVTPPPALIEKILYVRSARTDLPPVSGQEIQFWRSVAPYGAATGQILSLAKSSCCQSGNS